MACRYNKKATLNKKHKKTSNGGLEFILMKMYYCLTDKSEKVPDSVYPFSKMVLKFPLRLVPVFAVMFTVPLCEV